MVTVVGGALGQIRSGGIGGKKPRSPGDPLPLHEQPECVQRCADREGGKMWGSLKFKEMEQERWCGVDIFLVRLVWFKHHMEPCLASLCTQNQRDAFGYWIDKVCGNYDCPQAEDGRC